MFIKLPAVDMRSFNDLKKLDAYFGRIANGFADPDASWSEAKPEEYILW